MGLPFEKIEAAGNDFLLLDRYPGSEAVIHLCDRHHGIGGDGVMVYHPGKDGPVLDHYDCDGGRSFCLNGLRAAIHALFEEGRLEGSGTVRSEGMELAYSIEEEEVCIALPYRDFQTMTWSRISGYFVEVGNPQFVILENLDRDRFLELAPLIRGDRQRFPEGTNVNLLRLEDTHWHIITYERGVEGITRACGSGMYAAALVLMGIHHLETVSFVPEGRGTVTVTAKPPYVLFKGTTRRIAKGVWLC